jgi:hypothetical protein
MVATFLLRQLIEIHRTNRLQFQTCFKDYLITCTVEAYNKGMYTITSTCMLLAPLADKDHLQVQTESAERMW